jgi:amidase
MARTVEDLELALGLLAGPNRWDEPAWKLHLPSPRKEHPSGARVAVWLDDDRCRLDPEVRALLWKAATTLSADGAVVDADARPPFDLTRATNVFFPLLFAALSGGYPRDAVERFAADSSDGPVGQAHRGIAMRHRDWLSVNERRLQLRRQWEDFFASWDVILLPVLPIPAFPHDHSEPMVGRLIDVDGRPTAYWDVAAWMAPAGAGALPSTVVPVGLTASGLPVGVQVVGPFLHDLTTLKVASWLAERLGGCPTPPGFATA